MQMSKVPIISGYGLTFQTLYMGYTMQEIKSVGMSRRCWSYTKWLKTNSPNVNKWYFEFLQMSSRSAKVKKGHNSETIKDITAIN